jgi:hypothetical protein
LANNFNPFSSQKERNNVERLNVFKFFLNTEKMQKKSFFWFLSS